MFKDPRPSPKSRANSRAESDILAPLTISHPAPRAYNFKILLLTATEIKL